MENETWVKLTEYLDEELMVIGGHDGEGNAIYIGRALIRNNRVPANVVLKDNLNHITISFDDYEQIVEDCEILVNTGFQWIEFLPGERFPDNAVVAGKTADGTKQYIGRAFIDGALTPGRISADTKLLFLAYKGDEIIRDIGFEILVNENFEGILLRSPSPVAGAQSSSNAQKNAHNASMIAPTSTCAICLEENVVIEGIFMDCGHACLCKECIPKVNAKKTNGRVLCPICRASSLAARKIFYV